MYGDQMPEISQKIHLTMTYVNCIGCCNSALTSGLIDYYSALSQDADMLPEFISGIISHQLR